MNSFATQLPLKRQRLSNFINLLIPIVLCFSVISYHLCYGQGGALVSSLTSETITLKWAVSVILRFGLGILRDSALLYMLLGLRRRQYVSDAFHFWLISFVGGLLLIVFVYLNKYAFSKSSFYGQIFMLTRGSLPIVSGTFALILIQPWLEKLSKQSYASNILIFLLCLPLIFNQDIYGFNYVDSSMSVTALLVFGLLTVVFQKHTIKTRWLFITPAIGIVSFLFMSLLESRGGTPLTNASRFIGLMSPLSLIPAIILIQHLRLVPLHSSKSLLKTNQQIAPLFILFACILFGTSNYSNFITTLYGKIRSLLQFMHIFWLLGASIVFTLLIIIITYLASTVMHTKLWTKITDNWHMSLAEAFINLVNWKTLIRRLWHDYWRPILAVIVLTIIQLVSSLLMNQSFVVEGNIWQSDRALNIFAFIFAQQFNQQIVSIFILVTAYWLLISLSNRYWLSLISVSSFALIFAIANRIKIEYRSEPIVAADLIELKQLPELINMINPIVVILAIAAIILIAITIILIERKAQNASQSPLTRLTKFTLTAIFLFSLGTLNHTYSPTRKAIETFDINLNNINSTRYAQWYGPIMQYISGLDVQVMAAPKGYSKKRISSLVEKYQQRAKQINKTRSNTLKDTTVIFNLSESFSDPTHLTDLKVSSEPAPYIQSLKKQTTSGEMMSFGYGGGTANMEYMSLTGLSMGGLDSSLSTPYTQLIPKLGAVPNIGNDFAYSSAIHPYIGGFYNRIAVYQKFNFNKFAFLGSKYKIIDQTKLGSSPYLSDKTAYSNALAQINQKKHGQFINLISIQNHLPFNGWYSKKQYEVTNKTAGFMTDPEAVETYTEGVHYTDEAVKSFKAALDKINKPVVWVFYGDHLPGLYNVFTNGLSKYETDYFVYSNKYAREHGAKTKVSNSKFVGPNDFIALAYKQGNIKVNAYNALLTDVQNKLPAQWIKIANSRESSTEGTTFINETGKRIAYAQLSRKQKKLYHDYQLLLYDINAGKQYCLKDGMTR